LKNQWTILLDLMLNNYLPKFLMVAVEQCECLVCVHGCKY